MPRLITAICSVVLVTATSLAFAQTVQTYPLPDPDEAAGAPYTVTADGVSLPLEKTGGPGGRDETVYYARFYGVDEAEVVVSVSAAGTLEAHVAPARLLDGTPSVDGHDVVFSATGIGPRIVRASDDGTVLPNLIVILEPEETFVPDPARDQVFDITDYGAVADGASQTERIQAALDACASATGVGYVIVPAGEYVTGTLYIGSDTFLYLAPGSRLVASDDPAEFPHDPVYNEDGGHGRWHSFTRVLFFKEARNSGLMGRGTVDGNGQLLRNQKDRPVQIIDTHDCENITLEGVLLRHSASWTVHLVHSTNIHVHDLKIINDWDVGNADGINPDMCRNVLIERALCYTGDDSFAVKSTYNSDYLRKSYNITIRDSVVMTYKTSLKIGTETYEDIRNVLYENIDCVHASRGIAIWVRDGGRVSNVTFRKIRMELREIPGESMSGQPFYFFLSERYGSGSTLSEVWVEDVQASAPWFSFIESEITTNVKRITFQDVHLVVEPRVDKTEVKYLFEYQNAEDIYFKGLTVDWTQTQDQYWSGLWPDEAPFTVDGLIEIGDPHSDRASKAMTY